MNIHEYQAKGLFEEYGVPVPRGYPALDMNGVEQAIEALKNGKIVVKAQIHAGGRGKGTFADGYRGGVQIADGPDEAREAARRMLGNTLSTHQTGEAGRDVEALYLTEASDIEHEYYLAIVLDRESARAVIIASAAGGVDIEDVAAESPEKIVRVPVEPTLGLRPYQARRVAFGLGFRDERMKRCVQLIANLYRLFWEKHAMLVEVNPLIATPAGDLLALDAKVTFDDNALGQHPEIRELRDLKEEDPKEVEASEHGLNYIALTGNIACMVNGAGLAMATMDIIHQSGGEPANFLDVGGGADEEQVTAAFRIILSDANVEGVLVNIFGGIMRCDVIARGIVNAAKNVEVNVPLVVRLEGTNVDEGKRILRESDVDLTPADSLAGAAELIVRVVRDKASA